MRTVMVRYKVKADRAAENESYIGKVFEQLKSNMPSGLHYASFKLEDGVSFVHIAAYEEGDDRNQLGELSAFQAFTAQIKDRCEELPVTVSLQAIGNYRFFGE